MIHASVILHPHWFSHVLVKLMLVRLPTVQQENIIRKVQENRFCLTGAGLNNFIEKTKGVSEVPAIDGCPVDCAKKLMEENCIQNFEFIRVTDSRLEKGKSPATDESIENITMQGRSALLNKEILKGA